MTNLEQFRSTADEKSLGIIFNMLSTLYANPERSVMREYIANAIDSHQIAGTKRPVEVTLPTPASPNLVIRDFGTGLSLDDLKHVFFGFARSTKTDSDEQIGALGIGAKSAFALSKAWTVTNIHAGKKYVVASVNDASGPMQSVIVNGADTDEPSGITVSVPIERAHMGHSWDDTARELLRWFPKGGVTVHGLDDVSHWSDTSTVYGPLVLDNDDSRPYYHRVDFRIAMCGVAYVVDSETTDKVRQEALNRIDKILVEVEGADRYATAKSLAQVVRSQPASKDSADERIARQVSAHRSVLKALVETALRNVLLMDAGAIDFMPSRESVQGNPRTVDSITAALMSVLRQFADEVSASRVLVPSDRIAKTNELGNHIAGRSSTNLLDALGVHDVDTPVTRRKDRYSLHTLVNHLTGVKGSVLVHGMNSVASLYKRGIVERTTNQNIYTMDGEPTIDGFGDLTVLFRSTDERLPNALSREDYKALAAVIAPKSEDSYGRGGDTTTYSVYTMGSDPMTWESSRGSAEMTFDEIIDEYAGSDIPVYVVDLHEARTKAARGADGGLDGVVIARGRRHFDTFVRALEISIYTSEKLSEDTSVANITRMSALLGQRADSEVRDMLTYKDLSQSVYATLREVLRSNYGSLVTDDHRARKTVASYESGKVLLNSDERLNKSVSELAHLVKSSYESKQHKSLVPASLTAMLKETQSNPWPLLESVRGDATQLRHAAVYLAAVG